MFAGFKHPALDKSKPKKKVEEGMKEKSFLEENGSCIQVFLWGMAFFIMFSLLGCATSGKPVGSTHAPMYTITNSTSSITTTGTNVSSVVNTQTQSFLKPQRRWSLMGLVFGEKDPIPTTVPSGQSTQQGYSAQQTVVVEQPAYYYGYGYPYAYGYPYRYVPVYSGYGSCERRLFGVRFHTR